MNSTMEQRIVSQPEGAEPPRLLTMADAMMEALHETFEADPNVFLMGQDVGVMGGVAGQTRGLYERFGPDRVIDTPISESAFFGLAAGAAQNGLRPVVELMRVDFFGVAMDPIYNYIAKIGYCTDGSRRMPLTIMTQVGNPLRQGASHSQTLFGTFAHIPGLKLIAPSTSFDAKGLLRAAIACDDPVMFFFHSSLLAVPYGVGVEEYTGLDVPRDAYELPIGVARTVKPGDDVTIVSVSQMVHECLRSAKELQRENIDCEVIDLRTIVPLDLETIRNSVQRTGRLVVVDEDYLNCGLSGEILAGIAESGVALRSAPIRVARAQTPVAYSIVLDDVLKPTVASISDAVRRATR